GGDVLLGVLARRVCGARLQPLAHLPGQPRVPAPADHQRQVGLPLDQARRADRRLLPVSFLVDCPTLVAGGEAYARRAPEPLQAGPARSAAVAGTLALFWGVSIPAYLNRPWTRRWVGLLGARDGRDWMINSGVLSVDTKRA